MSEPVSAFAMYAMKRKSNEQPVNSKKLKKKHVTFEKHVVDANEEKQKLKQLTPHKNKRKGNNVAPINGIQVVNKRNVAPKKLNFAATSKKKNSHKKANSKNTSNNIKLLTKKNTIETPPISILSNALTKDDDKGTNIIQIKHKKQKNNKSKKGEQNIPNSVPVLYSPVDDNILNGNDTDPLATSHSMFEWMIHPLKATGFFEQNWEKTPIHIQRGRPNYYKFLMSTPLMDKILRDSYILFSKNIDITSYSNGIRETLNPPGRAVPSVVWDYYLNGCSVRMLNPQTYIPKLHALNATLQEFFGCFVGANSYLTPPNSQGFAPHYDDIEAFILQLEGKKRWRLYKPRYSYEYLARYSSKNFEPSEIGEPILDTVVNAGDLLYFPRGTIHQGETIDDTHSLHITLSVYQKNSWGDFLEKLLPDALNAAINNDSEFREGLPTDYCRYTGFVHSTDQSDAKKRFTEKTMDLFSRLVKYIDVNKAADVMAKNHIHDFLPPVLSANEQECSVIQDGEKMTANGVVEYRVEIEPDTRIRLIRSHCVRLVQEEGIYRVYYSCENSKEYHEYEPQYLDVTREFVPAVRELILRYPKFIRVEDLPIEGDDCKIQIVKDLWEKCIVVTDQPLCVLE